MPFLARKVMPMKKTQLVSTGIILALLGSNLVIGNQYIDDTKKYEQKLSVKSKIIEQNGHKLSEMVKNSVKNEQKMTDLTNKINLLLQDKNKLISENGKLKKEKEEIKKQIPSRGEVSNKRKFYVEATAYTAMCQEGCTGITFTEYDVRNTIYYNGLRILASDNSVIPLYSIVRVDTETESFEGIVLDRGGGIRNFEIDVLVKSEREANKFGRQKVLVTILREGSGN